MVYVTHDQVEAMTMADRIVVLRDGVVEQTGKPIELYARPRNQFVAGFLGAPQMNFLPATAAEGLALNLSIDAGRAVVAAPDRARGMLAGAAATLGIRPEHLSIDPQGPLAATVDVVEVLGAETIVHAHLPSKTPVTVSLRGISGVKQGAAIRLGLDSRFVHVFDENGMTLEPSRSWSEDYVLN